jgi:sialidase-1
VRRALTLLLAVMQLGMAAPFLVKTELFTGGEGGYKLYRIPGVVVTKKGTVLAYSEARRTGNGDWDSIDIVMRRSTDGGVTFAAASVIAHAPGAISRSLVAIERKQGAPGDVTYNNPLAIASRDGTVHFLFCLEYTRVFYMRSRDDGQTFSTPVEITSDFDAFRPEYAWRVVATGPGHGIELTNGRLVVPVWLALGTGGNGHHPSVNATVYSDDHGATWHRGDIAMPSTPQFPDPNETTLAQLADGRVMLNVRTEAKEHRRAIVTSPDGATHWSEPRLQQELTDPICYASLIRLSKGRLLFVNPDNETKERKNLSVRLSTDEGASWTIKRVLEPGPSGYSDLSVLPNGTILCLYEVTDSVARKILLARFNLEWLTGH